LNVSDPCIPAGPASRLAVGQMRLSGLLDVAWVDQSHKWYSYVHIPLTVDLCYYSVSFAVGMNQNGVTLVQREVAGRQIRQGGSGTSGMRWHEWHGTHEMA